ARLAARLPQEADGGFAPRHVAVDDDHLGAAFAEGERGGPTDAVAGAGDQRDLAGEIEIHRVLPILSTHLSLRGAERRSNPLQVSWSEGDCFASLAMTAQCYFFEPISRAQPAKFAIRSRIRSSATSSSRLPS